MAEEEPEKISEAADDGGKDSEEVSVSGGSSAGNLTTPEGVLMLMIAALLDGIGFLFFILGTWFGIDDYGILDAFGFLIIGGWMFLRSGLNSSVVKKGFRRFIEAFVVELVPFLGGASPSWIWLVYKTLKDG